MCSGGRNPLLRVLQNILRFSGCIPQSSPHVREPGFFPLRGYPSPPNPLAENDFAKKTLAEMVGTPTP